MIVQTLMRSLAVVKGKPLLHLLIQLRRCPGQMQVNGFVFQTSPEPLNENIILASSFSIHTDLHLMTSQYIQKFFAGELAPLIGVKDLRYSIAFKGLLHNPTTPNRTHGIVSPDLSRLA